LRLASRPCKTPCWTPAFSRLRRLPQRHGEGQRWIALAREFHFDGHIDTYYDPL
jgi:hypothetical protein